MSMCAVGLKTKPCLNPKVTCISPQGRHVTSVIWDPLTKAEPTICISNRRDAAQEIHSVGDERSQKDSGHAEVAKGGRDARVRERVTRAQSPGS